MILIIFTFSFLEKQHHLYQNASKLKEWLFL